MFIKEIEVKNFRSIRGVKFAVKDLNIFVGSNDAGKSNLLKALNLFFNGHTDSGVLYDFGSDYSSYARPHAKQAKQIEVNLRLSPPENYRENSDVIWRKSWRSQGPHEEKFLLSSKDEISPRSKLPTWLKSIKYNYIPAVKGDQYFSQLLGDLYSVLSRTTTVKLQNASENFINYLRDETKHITDNVFKRVEIESQVKFPDNLSQIFKALEFETSHQDKGVSLSRRGDGIKVRHIPSILKFIAEKENANKTSGSPKISTIWGYEEPENNLELTNAFKSAEEFKEYADEIQMFLTTHSSAFYTLDQKVESGNGKVAVFFVNQSEEGTRSLRKDVSENRHEIDEKMGLLPIISPYISQKVKELQALEYEVKQLKLQEGLRDFPTIFVEGDSDKIIFEMALEIFRPDYVSRCNVVSASCANELQKKVLAWILMTDFSHKAVGILDKDKAGNNAKERFNSWVNSPSIKDSSKGKLIHLNFDKDPSLRRYYQEKIRLPIAIEETFPEFLWQELDESGFLEEREGYIDFMTDTKAIERKGVLSHLNDLGFEKDGNLRLFKSVKASSKMQIVNIVRGLSEDEKRKALTLVNETLKKALGFLFPD